MNIYEEKRDAASLKRISIQTKAFDLKFRLAATPTNSFAAPQHAQTKVNSKHIRVFYITRY